MNVNYIGQGLATVGVCALVGFLIHTTGTDAWAWLLLVLLIVW